MIMHIMQNIVENEHTSPMTPRFQYIFITAFDYVVQSHSVDTMLQINYVVFRRDLAKTENLRFRLTSSSRLTAINYIHAFIFSFASQWFSVGLIIRVESTRILIMCAHEVFKVFKVGHLLRVRTAFGALLSP